MKKILTALVVAVPLVLSGCVIAVGGDSDHFSKDGWEHRQDSNRATISTLEMGVSIDFVKGKLGTPDFYEVYQEQGEQTKILFYRTHRSHSDSKTTKDECHFLKFEAGKLVAIGHGANAPEHF